MSARIDLYLNSLIKFNATAIVLASGSNVTLKFPAGDRFASQTTAHADLVALVEEVAPPRVLPDLRRNASTRFGYEALQGRPFSVSVEATPKSWKIVIEPGAPEPAFAAEPAGSGPSPIAAAAAAIPPLASDDLPIERTQYEAVPDPTPTPPPTMSPAAPSAAPSAASSAAPASRITAAASVAPGDLKPVERLLVKLKELGASDLHLSTGQTPLVRLHGEIQPVPGFPPYTADALLAELLEITPEKNRREFEERNDTDFAHSIPGVSRFRANIFRDRHGPGAVFRAIPFEILTPDQLGIPKGVLDLCFLTKGLVVVTGPTGSGKSTTLATLIDHVNKNRKDHIITIEDPIEFVHDNQRCLVNQREVHTHTRSFKDALRAALREDPDIVLVGEMRDLETIAIAVETAETGHLVFGTLHTTTAPSTVNRIIDQFPTDRQEQIRQMLSESLRGVIAQTLCRKIGGGRIAAYEILIANNAVANLIRERKTFQLFSLMQTGRAQGMVTLNDSLVNLVKRKLVEPKEAYMKSVNKAEMKNSLAREGFKVNLAEGAA